MARERDVIWDTWVELFQLPVEHKEDARRVGRMVSILKSRNATPELIRETTEKYRQQFPRVACTPDGVLNQWAFLQTIGKKTETQIRQAERQAQQEAGRRTQLQEAEREASEREEIISSLSDQTLDRYAMRVLMRATPEERLRWARENPRTHKMLRIRICHLIAAESTGAKTCGTSNAQSGAGAPSDPPNTLFH